MQPKVRNDNTEDKIDPQSDKIDPGKPTSDHIPQGANGSLQKNSRKKEQTEQKRKADLLEKFHALQQNDDQNLAGCFSDFSADLLSRLRILNMSESQAKGLINESGEKRLQKALEILDTDSKTKVIQNKGGDLTAIIRRMQAEHIEEKSKPREIQSEQSQKNWEALNKWINDHSYQVIKFHEAIVDQVKPDVDFTFRLKEAIEKYETQLINFPFDLLLKDRSFGYSTLCGLVRKAENL